MNQKNILGLAVLALLVLNVLTMAYLQFQINDLSAKKPGLTAYASGVVSLCVNQEPSDISEGTCNLTIPWGYYYQCQFNATDPENQSMIFAGSFLPEPNLFNITTSGRINVTPSEAQIGNYTLRLYAMDNSGCENNLYSEDFQVEVIDVNHPPYLIKTIPNQSIKQDNSYQFFLNSYFGDIDHDALNYSVIEFDTDLTLITIDSSSLVTIRGLDCGLSTFFFIAEDPFGLTNDSNMVSYRVTNCPIPPNGGGGGGGGGGSDCIPDWRCGQWGECQKDGSMRMECNDYNGCEKAKEFFKNCTYVPEEYICEEDWDCGDWSVCLNSTHTRLCTDKKKCGTFNNRPNETESCIPIASCFNGIKDGDETDIDCGGQCGSCKIEEQPIEVPGVNKNLIIAAIITLFAVIIILLTLRKQILGYITYLLAKYSNKKMPIYLNDVQKQKVLNIIFKSQDYLDNDEITKAHNTIMQAMEIFYNEMLGIPQIDQATIKKKMSKLNNVALENIMIKFYAFIMGTKGTKPSKILMQEYIDNATDHLFLTAYFQDKDALVIPKVREIEGGSSVENCLNTISNIHIALSFKELREAKNFYRNILEAYNKLTEPEKKSVFNDIMLAYNIIIYLERYYG